MKNVLVLFLLGMSTASFVQAGFEHQLRQFLATAVGQSYKPVGKKETKIKSLKIKCERMHNNALIYGEISLLHDQYCKGSDGKNYKVYVETLGVSAIHVCNEKVVLRLKSPKAITPEGTWHGLALHMAFLGDIGGHFMMDKSGSVMGVTAVGCGIGLLLGYSKLKIQAAKDVASEEADHENIDNQL